MTTRTTSASLASQVTGHERFMKQNWPFYWVSRINARYVEVLESRLKLIGLDMPRWRVLVSLHESDHLSVSEIAEFGVMKLNTATKVIQRMIADDLVETRTRPTDGRVTEVRLTERGRDKCASAMAEAEQILAASFVGITPAELATLNAHLEKVLTRLNGI